MTLGHGQAQRDVCLDIRNQSPDRFNDRLRGCVARTHKLAIDFGVRGSALRHDPKHTASTDAQRPSQCHAPTFPVIADAIPPLLFGGQLAAALGTPWPWQGIPVVPPALTPARMP